MNELEIFKNEEFGEVRVIEKDGEPWFVAKDVADILGYSDTEAMKRRLDNDDFMPYKLSGMNMTSIILSESGLYSAIIGSKKPDAKKFKKWVTHEVLPSIRKTGAYIAGQKIMSDEEIMAHALIAANKMLEEKDQENKTLKIKADVADQIANTKGLILPADAGKIICGKPNNFVKWLEDTGIFFRRKSSGALLPRAIFHDRGYCKVKISTKGAWEQTYFTPKGLAWICAKYQRDHNLLVFPVAIGK